MRPRFILLINSSCLRFEKIKLKFVYWYLVLTNPPAALGSDRATNEILPDELGDAFLWDTDTISHSVGLRELWSAQKETSTSTNIELPPSRRYRMAANRDWEGLGFVFWFLGHRTLKKTERWLRRSMRQ